jgi:hypothetical protein
MSFAFGVFDPAVQYGAMPDLEVRLVAGEPEAAIRGAGVSYDVRYDLEAVEPALDVAQLPLKTVGTSESVLTRLVVQLKDASTVMMPEPKPASRSPLRPFE